jgi:P4 family phage/plasmid primase-like protien
VLAEVFNGDDKKDPHEEAKLRYLQRFAGYTLLGLTHEKTVLVPHGPRDTAKSTVTEALYRALGDVADGGYATTWDAEVIEAGTKVNRNEKLDKARPARMVIAGELEKGSRMADGFVKRYSGGDTMDACAKYKPSYSYRPQGKLWLPTNYVPRSADKAVQGRLGLLPFRHVPEKLDRSIKDHLDRDEGAHRAVLAWAMRGLEDYLDARQAGNERPLGETPWLDALLREYAKGSDPLRDFIEACFQEVEVKELKPGEDDGSPHVDDVWAAYRAWATDNVPRPLKRRTLDYALQEHGFEKQRVPSHGGSMRWRGLTWRSPDDIPHGVKAAVKTARASLEMLRGLT